MVVNLAYDSKLFIKDYIECRYKNSPEMLKKELLFLSKFNKELIKSAKKCDRFSKSGTNEIIGAIEKLIKISRNDNFMLSGNVATNCWQHYIT